MGHRSYIFQKQLQHLGARNDFFLYATWMLYCLYYPLFCFPVRGGGQVFYFKLWRPRGPLAAVIIVYCLCFTKLHDHVMVILRSANNTCFSHLQFSSNVLRRWCFMMVPNVPGSNKSGMSPYSRETRV